MRALSMIRSQPHYRADAIEAGLRAIGYRVEKGDIRDPKPGDLVVIWNRYGQYDSIASRFERAGAAVIVVENGYLGATYEVHGKPFGANGKQIYAMALWHHNGAGQWWIGEPGRWRQQGIEVRPWRQDGKHVLVLPQRGIGPPGVAMPKDWPQQATDRLRRLTNRPVRLRQHPGNRPSEKPLEADLEGCWCAVTWGSGAALKAICAGVPVFCDFDRWIGRLACIPLDYKDRVIGKALLECPFKGAREAMLNHLAWAQWDTREIASGEPFRRLMGVYEGRKAAA